MCADLGFTVRWDGQVKSGERFISPANLLCNYSCALLETKVILRKFSLPQITRVQERMKPRLFSERKGCHGKGKLAGEPAGMMFR